MNMVYLFIIYVFNFSQVMCFQSFYVEVLHSFSLVPVSDISNIIIKFKYFFILIFLFYNFANVRFLYLWIIRSY